MKRFVANLAISFAFLLQPSVSCTAGEPLRVGIYSGTFDPPHLGHLELAKKAVEQLHLDIVYIVPAVQAFHKPHAVSYPHRKKMSEILFGQLKEAVVSPPEVEEGYAADRTRGAVKVIMESYPDAEFFRITGDDTLSKTINAMSPEQRARTTLVIGPREGENKAMSELSDGGTLSQMKVRVLQGSDQGYSSSLAKRLMLQGVRPRNLDEGVWAYIQNEGLYGAPKKVGGPNRACEEFFSTLGLVPTY